MYTIEKLGDEKLSEFYQHFNKNVENEILTHDEIQVKLNLTYLCEYLLKHQIGKIVTSTINGEYVYCLMLDLGQYFAHHWNHNFYNFFNKIDKKKFDIDLKFYIKDIYNICPTTVLFFTNLKFDHWYDQDSPIKAILEAYPCYNMLGFTDNLITDEQILNSNNTRILNLKETKEKIASLEYIQNEINGIPNIVK